MAGMTFTTICLTKEEMEMKIKMSEDTKGLLGAVLFGLTIGLIFFMGA